MARLTRILQNIFAGSPGTNQVAQFGSLAASAPAFTTNPATAQALSNWQSGWFAAVIDGASPAIEDMNAAMFVMTYQLAYILANGIPEWQTGTTYYTGQTVSDANGVFYTSLADSNTGNLLTDVTKWRATGGAILTTLGDLMFASTAGAATRLGGNTSTTRAVLTQKGTGSASAPPEWTPIKDPTYQIFNASGTYTLPSGPAPRRIEIMVLGAGGGGGGTGSNGGAGGDSSFDSIIVAGGGGGGLSTGGSGNNSGGTPSGPTVNSPAVDIGSVGGGAGCSGQTTNGAYSGGNGGSSSQGGAGLGGHSGAAGILGTTNSGGGGGGAGSNGSAPSQGGGASGATARGYIDNPSSTYTITVGAAGAAGGGSVVGGAGAKGRVIVKEIY